MNRLAILITCYNRKQFTLTCLKIIAQQEGLESVAVEVFVVDDGSTDGTTEAIAAQYPAVTILRGNGSLYWNRGMHLAFGAALAQNFDYYLWLNDDTFLYQNAIITLLNEHLALKKRQTPDTIMVGSLQDPLTNQLSYGGYTINRQRASFKFQLVTPAGTAKECETMCGNCVLIPGSVATAVGNIDPLFKHRWGDVDYGLRAQQKDCSVYITAGFVGTCQSNPLSETWQNTKLPFLQRIKELHSVKGLEKKDWFRFNRRHGGFFWPITWARPYARIGLTSLLAVIKTNVKNIKTYADESAEYSS